MATPVQEQLIARRMGRVEMVCMPRQPICHGVVLRKVLMSYSPIRLSVSII
jgi:hypothetical protein